MAKKIVVIILLALILAAVFGGIPLMGPDDTNANEDLDADRYPEVDGEYGEDETHLINDPLGYKNDTPYWWEKDPGPLVSFHPLESDCGRGECEFTWRTDHTYSTEKITNQIIERTNEFRQQEGVEKVTHLEVLDSYARGMALDMHQREYYGHDLPSGEMKSKLFQGNVDETVCETYSENVNAFLGDFDSFFNDAEDARPLGPTNETAGNKLYTDWYNSPTHKENMIRFSHDYIGVGIAKDPNEKVYYYVQMILCRDEPPELPRPQTPIESD